MTVLTEDFRFRLNSITAGPRRVAVAKVAALLGRADLPAQADFFALRPATRVLMTGLAAWIGLVLVVGVVAACGVQLFRFSTPAWLDIRGSAAGKAQTAAIARYDNIVQRPLFSRSRQAPSVAAPVVAAAPAPVAVDPGFILKGVFMSDGVAKAFLLTAQNPVGTWVEADGEIAGWRVVGIQPDQVVLDSANQRRAVPLNMTAGR